MAETVAYDKTVHDFIAGLDATGHVTHTTHVKKNVTFHHNAGNLSLQGILDVWTTREASAHFQVDMYGAVGQYVRVYEYAWANGVTLANQESISIEMANLNFDPTWEVRSVTWREAARLCGWLHAKIIGVRPSRTTMRKHKDWKATTCSGPYIDTVFDTMIADSQASYDYFTAPTPVIEPEPEPEPIVPPPPPPPPPDPVYEVTYVAPPADPPAPTPWTPPPAEPLWVPQSGLPLTTVAADIIAGRWGPRETLGSKLRANGYNAEAVRVEMFRILHATGGLQMVKRKFRQ